MKKILCFGDSNTFGYNPSDGSRFPKNIRWTGILSELLGENYHVIEGGCNNRNCFAYNPISIEMNGDKVLPKYLKSNPDMVLLALGINDLQKFYNVNTKELEDGIKNLVLITRSNTPNAAIAICAPSRLSDAIYKGNFSFQFNELSVEKSKKIQSIYKKAAEDLDCYFINFDEIVHVSDIDGLHYEAYSHNIIAQKLYEFILALSKNS